MAASYKILGQINPSATTASSLYTVPAATSAVCSTLVIANTATVATTFRIAVRPAGATLATQHYLLYDGVIAANDAIFLTLGITLASTDVVTVYAGSASIVFNLFGSELT